MTNTLTVTVTLSNDYVVTYTTSVQKYAKEALTDEDTTEEQSAVLTAMLDYGSAAQAFYGYKADSNDTLANGGGYATDVSTVTADDVKNYGGKKTTSTTGDWDKTTNYFSSMNLYGDYDETLTLTFTFDLEECEVSVTLGGTNYSTDSYSASGKILTISDLGAGDLTKTLVVTITKGSDSYTVKTTGLYYARLVLANSSNTEVKTQVAKTIYLYAKSVAALAQ